MDFIFDENRLTNTFNKLNKYDTINLVWKRGLCKASRTGHGSNLFDLLEPISHIDFFNKLIEYSTKNINTKTIYNRGLTLEESFNLAKEFKQSVEDLNNSIQFNIEDYLDYIVYVNVIQTFDGHINEVMLVNYIKKYYYPDAHKASGELDSKYGIDILYRNDTRGVQVKSINFFLGQKQSTINDRQNIKTLKEEVNDKFNIDMKYAIFDRKTFKYIKNVNNTPIFSFDEFQELLNCKQFPHKVLKLPQMSVE